MDVFVCQFARYLAFDRMHRGIGEFDGDGFICLIVIRLGESGPDKGMSEFDFPCRVDGDTPPDARISVADTVLEGKIPADRHQHGGVEANVAISSIAVFAPGCPGFGLVGTRNIHRINLYSQHIFCANLRKIGDVGKVLHEHSGYGADEMAVQPYFCPVVDPVGLEPECFVLVTCREGELRAEPVGVKISSYLGDVGDQIAAQFVVKSEIGFRIDFIAYQRMKYRAGHDGGHPIHRQVACVG